MIAATFARTVCTVAAACAVAAVAAGPGVTWAIEPRWSPGSLDPGWSEDLGLHQTQDSRSARLQGRIVAADTGAAVRGATVTCSIGGTQRTEWTDGDGRFECRDLPASVVTLRVVKAGFIEATAGLGVSLKEGQSFNRGEVRIVRGAVIAGRVLDASGEPLSDAIVNAWRVGYPQPGNRRVVAARVAVSTNDLGEYRLYGLAAGTYYVSVAAYRGLGPQTLEVASAGPDYVQLLAANPGSGVTYYPGTAYPSEAQTVPVQGGHQALGVDMRLVSGRLPSLSGRVVDSFGQAVANRSVSLRSARSDGFVTSSGAVTDASGRFTLLQPGPGEYRLMVTTSLSVGVPVTVAPGQPPIATHLIRREAPESANVLVTIGAGPEPANELLIQTRPGNELRGRVLVDGAVPAPVASGRFMMTMSPEPDGVGGTHSAGAVAPDGTFAIPGLIGRGRLLALGAPVGTTLLRVIANGLDVTDDGVDMDRGNVGGVEVHMTTRLTLVRGQVSDDTGTPGPGAVIVYSENPALWSKPNTRHVAYKATASGGSFEFAGLPAGRYLAVAVEQVVPDQWADPENLLRLRPQATPFTVVEGELVTLALRRK